MNVASIVRILAAVAWIVFIGILAIVIMRASRNKNFKGPVTMLLIVLAGAVILSTVAAGLVFIQPEERGVVISAIQPTGYRVQPLQPGLRWIIPFFETVVTLPHLAPDLHHVHRSQ